MLTTATDAHGTAENSYMVSAILHNRPLWYGVPVCAYFIVSVVWFEHDCLSGWFENLCGNTHRSIIASYCQFIVQWMCMLSTLWRHHEHSIMDGKELQRQMYPGIGQNSTIPHWGWEGSFDKIVAKGKGKMQAYWFWTHTRLLQCQSYDQTDWPEDMTDISSFTPLQHSNASMLFLCSTSSIIALISIIRTRTPSRWASLAG